MMSKELTPLKALERIKYKLSSSKANGYWEDLDIIETALKEYKEDSLAKDIIIKNMSEVINEDEKKLKALEIIKERPIVALVDYKYTYEEWLELVDEKDKDLFKNREEFDLLKRIL